MKESEEMTIQLTTISLPDRKATQQLGRILGESLPVRCTILLTGELGAGKTTLVGGIGEGLGIKEPIVSPTFTLINEYLEGRSPLYHLDLYRLSAAEVEALFIESYWEGSEVVPGITAIEWAERLPYLPPSYLDIQLTYDSKEGRSANLSLVGDINFDLARFKDKIDNAY